MSADRPLRGLRAPCALLLASVLHVACASPPPASPEGPASWQVRPLVWRADGPNAGDGPVFLLGSVHVGRAALQDFGPAVAEAYESSDELVVEVDLSQLSEREIVAQTLPHMLLPKGRRLRDEVSPATWAKLEDYFRERGDAIAGVERMRPWAVSTWIAMMEFEVAGMQGEYGVDRHFISAAAEGNRAIRGLETVESQMQIFSDLSPSLQELMLEDALARVDTDPAELVSAWETGDEEQLTQQLLGPLEENPEFTAFYEALFFERNEAMAAQIAALVGDGRRRFVVLGAAHMLGDRGIPALLQLRGFRVDRISGR